MPRPKNVIPPVPENATMLTLSQAVAYAGVNKAVLKSALENPRFSNIFDNAVKITHFHPEVPDLVEINRSALDAWKIAKETKAIGTRATRNGQPRRYIVKFTDDRLQEVQDALAPLDLSVQVAYQKRRNKTPPNLFQAELVEENELVSA